MITTIFLCVLGLLMIADLVKGLSANGTPPVLQRFSWQLHLAHFMWSHIVTIRIVLVVILIGLFWSMTAEERSSIVIFSLLIGAAWGFVYWFFNHFWVGKKKFLPLTHPKFVTAADNEVDPSVQVVGIEWQGHKKAFPVSMMFYHHQIPERIGDLPIWVTYCGLCRSGRVYKTLVGGQVLDFSLVGAITYNATFKDNQTGSWWRQETGECVKGPHAGKELEDLPMEQMSLENWLEKHPDTEILQYEPKFKGRYNFITSLMNYEASLPGWHMQETPALVIGVEVGAQARAYDWNELKKKRMVMDSLADSDLLVVSSEDGSSAFVYDRQVNGEALEFELDGDELTDRTTGSRWDILGRCIAGTLQGNQLAGVQNYQQFVRSWATFHPHTTYYQF